ncbi:MAG TPA: HrcA family transcriptional regulator, partial [Clostridia bacterium]|nr:HrcA family transcriptional regulator [Clostridia bacterium]
MNEHNLSERKLKVLRAIVDDYISTAMPVGSKTVAMRYGSGISSATIRNEMSILEEMGYLEQPHTSAGRIPSDLAYRLYVDKLMNIPEFNDRDIDYLRSYFTHRIDEVEEIIHASTKI